MKYFVLPVLFLLCCNLSASERTYKTVKGLSFPLVFEKTDVTRGSPTVYFDQAVLTITETKNNIKFHCRERFVNFGEVSLSVYCFTENESKFVVVGGELVKGNSAWVYSVNLEQERLDDQLIILIEALNNYAYGRL